MQGSLRLDSNRASEDSAIFEHNVGAEAHTNLPKRETRCQRCLKDKPWVILCELAMIRVSSTHRTVIDYSDTLII